MVDADLMCRKLAGDILPIVEGVAAQYPKQPVKVEENYCDHSTHFWSTYMPGHSVLLSVRHVYDSKMKNPWEFEFWRGIYVPSRCPTQDWVITEIPERQDEKMVVASELLPLVYRCAKNIGFTASVLTEQSKAGNPSLTFGGRFELADWHEVIGLARTVNSLIDYRLKEFRRLK